MAVVTLTKTFFPKHPKAGEETRFRGKVLTGAKRHTCRPNYPHWKRVIEGIQAKGGVLSVRQWIGRPYHQPGQETVIEVPADQVGVQLLELRRERIVTEFFVEEQRTPFVKVISYEWTATVDGYNVPIDLLAENDGLTVEDFKAWFAPAFNKAEKKYPALAAASPATIIEFAIIHFTKLRYGAAEHECTNTNPYGLKEYRDGCIQNCGDCDYNRPKE